MSSPPSYEVPFRFVCCQIGAERALKEEMGRLCPTWRFAFSRPGFVTFKVLSTGPSCLGGGIEPAVRRSVFARAAGFSAGKLSGDDPETLAAQLAAQLPPGPFQGIHVWQRDADVPGTHGFEPFPTSLAQDVGEKIAAAYAKQLREGDKSLMPLAVNRRAPHHAWVIDVVLVEPNQWWFGWHQVTTIGTSWPGGVPPLVPKDRTEIVSRAYWKMLEGLAWSRLPVRAGDPCIELGSSPGGACQALLEKGLVVLGIDPAVMDPRVMAHPNFHHIRAKAADLKRREFAGVPWLFMDANVAPQYTLDAVEAIVTNRRVHTKGMLLTMKLTDWDLAQQIDRYLACIEGWGFRYVRARQLAFNRQEICVVALRRKHLLRIPPAVSSLAKDESSTGSNTIPAEDLANVEESPANLISS